MWYKKIIKAVFYNIDNLKELEKLKAEKCRVKNARFTGFIKALINFKVIPDFNQFKIDISGNFNQDIIFINVFIGVNKNFLKSVKRLLNN